MTDRVTTQRGRADPSKGAVERSDIDPATARRTILGLAAIVLIVAGSVALLFHAFGAVRQPSPSAPTLLAPAPALQIDERNDRIAIEARAKARLEGAGGGTPIEEAMRATAAAGWDAPR